MQVRCRQTLLGARGTVGIQPLAKRYLMKEVRDAIGSNVATALEQAKGTIFGLMAKNMNEKDFNKFFSHWHERLEDSHQHSNSKIVTPTQTTPIVAPLATEKQSSQKISTSSLSSKPIIIPKSTGASFVYHPLLGELVSSVGYKKVYLTNVHALARTPVWKRQRILRPERAALIAEDKIRKGTAHSLPGVITMYQDITTSEIGIIDGQHRAGALMVLAQRGYWDGNKNNIAVEVFPTNGEKSIAALFSAINAAEPVRLIDLPETQEEEEDAEDEKEKQEVVAKEVSMKNNTNCSVKEENKDAIKMAPENVAKVDTLNTNINNITTKTINNNQNNTNNAKDNNKTVDTDKNNATKVIETLSSASGTAPSSAIITASSSKRKTSATQNNNTVEFDRDLITSVTETLRTKYPEMFKPTSRCKIPHLNLDVLRDDLFQANVLRMKRFASAEELLTKLEKINLLLGEKLLQMQEDKDKQQGDSRWEMKSFETALDKAKKYGFYLGMEKDWMYDKSLWSKDI